MRFSRNVTSLEDYTLDDFYEIIEESMKLLDEVNLALVDMASIRLDKEMQNLKNNIEDAWYNAYKMLNKLKKELN